MLYFDDKEEPKEETYIKFDKETYIKDGALPFRPMVKLPSNPFRSDDREITPLQKELEQTKPDLKEPLQGLEITSIDEVLQNKIRYMMTVKMVTERQIYLIALERYHTEVKNSIERLERVRQLINLVRAKEEETTEDTTIRSWKENR